MKNKEPTTGRYGLKNLYQPTPPALHLIIYCSTAQGEPDGSHKIDLI